MMTRAEPSSPSLFVPASSGRGASGSSALFLLSSPAPLQTKKDNTLPWARVWVRNAGLGGSRAAMSSCPSTLAVTRGREREQRSVSHSPSSRQHQSSCSEAAQAGQQDEEPLGLTAAADFTVCRGPPHPALGSKQGRDCSFPLCR